MEHDYVNTSNKLTLRRSGEQIRLQFLPKLLGLSSWILQVLRQRSPDCWSRYDL